MRALLQNFYLAYVSIILFFVFSAGVIVYDPINDAWSTVNSDLPKARVGSCALVHKDKILLIGGKGHLEDLTGSDEVCEFNPSKREWNNSVTWPMMKRQRYYHGCTLGLLNGEEGLLKYSSLQKNN